MIIIWASPIALRALSNVVGDQKLIGTVGGVVPPEGFPPFPSWDLYHREVTEGG